MSTWSSADLGATRATISSEIVRLYANYYGRGPTRARTYLGRDYCLTILEDLLTQAERTLAAAGRADHVRRTRLVFQEALREEFIAVVEQATGRKVRAFMSQNHVEPEMASELFIFEPSDDDDNGRFDR